MSFFPTGPLTITSMIIIWSLSAWLFLTGSRDQKFIAVALLISWIGARLATVTELHIVAAAGMTLAAIFAYCGLTLISRSIAILYALRLGLLSLVGFGYDWFVFWELNRVILYLQILLALGTLWPDGKRNMGALPNRSPDRRPAYNLGLSQVRRYLRQGFRRNP